MIPTPSIYEQHLKVTSQRCKTKLHAHYLINNNSRISGYVLSDGNPEQDLTSVEDTDNAWIDFSF